MARHSEPRSLVLTEAASWRVCTRTRSMDGQVEMGLIYNGTTVIWNDLNKVARLGMCCYAANTMPNPNSLKVWDLP